MKLSCFQVSGQCPCRPEFGGRQCDECGENHFGNPDLQCICERKHKHLEYLFNPFCVWLVFHLFIHLVTYLISSCSKLVTATWKELSAHHVTLRPVSACVGLVSLVSSVMSVLLATTRHSLPVKSATPVQRSGLKTLLTSSVLLRGWGPSFLARETTSLDRTATGSGCWRCTPSWKLSPTWRHSLHWRWRRWQNCTRRLGMFSYYNKKYNSNIINVHVEFMLTCLSWDYFQSNMIYTEIHYCGISSQSD